VAASGTNLFEDGRWPTVKHPEAADRTAWTRQNCASWIAAPGRMRIDAYVSVPPASATGWANLNAARRVWSFKKGDRGHSSTVGGV
jgi:hypothetical protein